jgi:hypothetical protein
MLAGNTRRTPARRIRLARAGALGLMLLVITAGCSLSSVKKSIDKTNRENSATGSLESFITSELATKFHRPARSVSCTPYVDEVLMGDTAHFTCKVRFIDGSSYTTAGTVTDPSTDPDYATYNYSFYDPPGVDITTAPLPGPILTLPANSPRSLFLARNLTLVIKTIMKHFGRHDLIIQLAIYPGEVEGVLAANGGKAWLVTATYYNTLRVGARTSFNGSRSGIDFSQLDPKAIQQLATQIAAKGGVPLSGINRFVLTNSLPDNNSGWNIYPTRGTRRFQALVLGQHLVMITSTGTRALN